MKNSMEEVSSHGPTARRQRVVQSPLGTLAHLAMPP